MDVRKIKDYLEGATIVVDTGQARILEVLHVKPTERWGGLAKVIIDDERRTQAGIWLRDIREVIR